MVKETQEQRRSRVMSENLAMGYKRPNLQQGKPIIDSPTIEQTNSPAYTGPAEGTAENLAIANQNTITPAPTVVPPVVQPENKLGESTVIGPVKPVITPALQAKIDAKKNGIAPVVPTETIMPVETTPTPEVVSTEVKAETVTTPTEVKTEVTDLEKNAQATGVGYSMVNGSPVYNPKTTEEAAKVLAMGGKLAGENKMTAVAQASLNKVRGLGQMTDQQLANNIAGGQVSNKELELLNTMNPQLVAQAKELSKKKVITNTTNEIQADNSAIIKGKEPTGMSKPLQDLVTKLADIDADTKSPAEMKTAYQDSHPEMIQSRDEINNLTKQKRDLQMAKMKLYDDTKAKLSGYPQSMIMAAYSAASRDLDDSIYLLNDDLNTEISNYNMYLDDMNAEIDFEIGQQGKEEQRLWDVYGVTSKEQIRNEDIQREDARIEQSIALEEQRYQRDIERDDMKSAQERKYKIEDMKNEMNMNIETGLMNLGVDPTGMTPEEMRATYAQATGYQAQQKANIDAYNATKGKWSIQKINGKDVRVNADTGEILPTTQTSESKYGFTNVGDGLQVNVNSTEQVPKGRRQCGAYVNDNLFGGSGNGGMGDSIESKLQLAVNDKPIAGSAFVMDFGNAEQPGENGIRNGHTGMVEQVRDDGIVVSDMNRTGNEEFRRVFIPFNSQEYSYIKGYTQPTEAAQNTQIYTSIEEVQLPEKATEYSKKSYGFGVRMDQAEKSIKNMEEKYKDSWAGSEYMGSKLPNWLKSGDRQAFDQAGRNFINAVLRQESGAVISDTEFDNAYKQYIPQPGDAKETLAQKAQSRKTAILNMLNSAGRTENGESIRDIYNSIDITNSY